MNVPSLAGLRAAGLLSPLDEHFARAVGRIAAEERPEVLLAAALASRYVAGGHVCVDLERLAGADLLVDDTGHVVTGLAWPDPGAWVAALRASPLVGDGNAPTPLVLDGSSRLYLRRYWEHEQRLAQAITARATAIEAVDAAWLRPRLERLFPAAPGGAAEPNWQRVAAALALQRGFCVISGGPGTGKTYTVVKLLALLIEQAQRCRQPAPRLALLAPTGKAAARLAESIRRAKGDLDCPPEVMQAIPGDTATIHRCLGAVPGRDTRFRHDARNPLLADVVLVDEASMVDLALMARLADALPPRARLILLGDRDQLASVEAGAVLGDICNTGARCAYSHRLLESLASLTGVRLVPAPDAPADGGIGDCVVQLTRSYRYGSDSGIGALARAINAGDAAAALAVLDAGAYPDVERRDPPEGDDLGASLRQAVLAGYGPCLDATPAVTRLRTLERFRVLCAHRRGPGGVEVINRQIEATLASAGFIRPETKDYPGRAVIVTRNDYQLALFNGDVGLMVDAREVDDADAPPGGEPLHGRSATRALFFGADGVQRLLSPARLPAHETVFAMTVHKSQGSEFDEVAVLLPSRPSPVATRELLYTAVTRARRKVVLYASPEVIKQAIARRIERASGLRERLWGSPQAALLRF